MPNNIYFITDVWPGEQDILKPIKHLPLILKNEDGTDCLVMTPPGGEWSHESLCQISWLGNLALSVDAYLGESFVGSTEC